ncbi:Proline-rich protein 1 [Bienertia sinuspersici]
MIVDKSVHGKNLKPKDCLVRLVSSPDESCHVATDFGHGKSGVKLRQPSVVYRGMTKYVVGPFYYTTPTCDDEPDTPSQGSY